MDPGGAPQPELRHAGTPPPLRATDGGRGCGPVLGRGTSGGVCGAPGGRSLSGVGSTVRGAGRDSRCLSPREGPPRPQPSGRTVPVPHPAGPARDRLLNRRLAPTPRTLATHGSTAPLARTTRTSHESPHMLRESPRSPPPSGLLRGPRSPGTRRRPGCRRARPRPQEAGDERHF